MLKNSFLAKELAQFVWNLRAGFQKITFNHLMDKDDINELIEKCRKLKYKFCGVFAANKIQQKLCKNSFLVVNDSLSNSPGTHWLLLCNRNIKIIFVDHLGQSSFAYKDLYHRLSDNNAQICQFLEHQPIQSQNSELCGIFLFFIKHVIFIEGKL